MIIDPAQQVAQNSDGAQVRWLHQQLNVATSGGTTTGTATIPVAFSGCILPNVMSQSDNYFTCIFTNSYVALVGSNPIMIGGAHIGAFVGFFGTGGAEIKNVITQGSPFSITNSFGSIFCLGDWGIFDTTGDAMDNVVSILYADGGSEHIYGSGNSGVGMKLRAGASFFAISANRVITGDSGDLIVGNISKIWSNTPYFDHTILAGVADPTISARGAGTFNLNGTGTVHVPASTIVAVDFPAINRTSIVGSAGILTVTAINGGTGFDITSNSGTDTGACSFKLIKG